MNIKNLLHVVTAFGFVVAAESAAQAEVVQYNYNTAVTTFGTTPKLVPITSTGGTSISFVSKKAGLTAVTFSAECSVYGSAANRWLTIDIYIDGVAVDPTSGNNDAFCTEVSNEYNYSTNSITVAKNLAKGTHTLTVQSYVTADTGWLDDIAVVVSR